MNDKKARAIIRCAALFLGFNVPLARTADRLGNRAHRDYLCAVLQQV